VLTWDHLAYADEYSLLTWGRFAFVLGEQRRDGAIPSRHKDRCRRIRTAVAAAGEGSSRQEKRRDATSGWPISKVPPNLLDRDHGSRTGVGDDLHDRDALCIGVDLNVEAVELHRSRAVPPMLYGLKEHFCADAVLEHKESLENWVHARSVVPARATGLSFSPGFAGARAIRGVGPFVPVDEGNRRCLALAVSRLSRAHPDDEYDSHAEVLASKLKQGTGHPSMRPLDDPNEHAGFLRENHLTHEAMPPRAASRTARACGSDYSAQEVGLPDSGSSPAPPRPPPIDAMTC
jgi:hypothetical protein